MVKTIVSRLQIPDYTNEKNNKKKYVCYCEICFEKFKSSIEDAEICPECVKNIVSIPMIFLKPPD